MTSPRDIVARLDVERFSAILAASPRAFREDVFRKCNVRVKSHAFRLDTAASKNAMRVERLLDTIRNDDALQDDVLEEIIRNYLVYKRTLLIDALDYFKVKHDNGLTDEDLDFMEKLSDEERRKLRVHLESKHDAADVELYLAFMKVPA